MSNTLKVILGLVVGLIVISTIWSGIKSILFIAVALGLGYVLVKKVFIGKGKKDGAE